MTGQNQALKPFRRHSMSGKFCFDVRIQMHNLQDGQYTRWWEIWLDVGSCKMSYFMENNCIKSHIGPVSSVGACINTWKTILLLILILNKRGTLKSCDKLQLMKIDNDNHWLIKINHHQLSSTFITFITFITFTKCLWRLYNHCLKCTVLY